MMMRIRGCWGYVRDGGDGSGVDMVLRGLSSVERRNTRPGDVEVVVAVANVDGIGIG